VSVLLFDNLILTWTKGVLTLTFSEPVEAHETTAAGALCGEAYRSQAGIDLPLV